jgi:hypothetical protein
MRTSRSIVGVGVLTLGFFLTGVTSVGAQSNSETPKATEIGVTSSEIKIAVVADVDNPFAPGLFQGVVDGVEGAAKYLNSKAGGGGIAGRKLAVDFIDSKLNASEARNAVITACGQDLALVGTAALFLSTMDDAVNCKDQAGATVGLPDFGAIVSDIEGCAPIAFPVNPPALQCGTIDQNPQTYRTNQGAYVYLQKQHKQDLHGAMLFATDTKASARGGSVLIDGAIHAGIKADQNVGVSGRDPQSAYTPIVQKMKQDSSNFGYTTSASSSAISLMSEAQLQGLTDPNMVWMCTTACYDKSIQTNAATQGVNVALSFLPFTESSTNKTLAAFLKNVGPSKVNGFAVYGFTSTLAFADALKAAVAKSGVNGITRSAVLDGAKTLTAFDAGGMIGTVNISEKLGTACTMLVQLEKNQWQRVWPAKKGTFDCKASNSLLLKKDV